MCVLRDLVIVTEQIFYQLSLVVSKVINNQMEPSFYKAKIVFYSFGSIEVKFAALFNN